MTRLRRASRCFGLTLLPVVIISSPAEGSAVNAVVAVVTADGLMTVFDAVGRDVGSVNTQVEWPSLASFASNGRVVLLDDDNQRAVVADAATGDLSSYIVPDGTSLEVFGTGPSKVVAALSTYGSWMGVVASPSLGVAIDLGSRDVQQLFVDSPLFVQWGVVASDGGVAAAIADFASASTVVVSFVGAETFVVPGIPAGFSNGHLVTLDRGPTVVTVRYFERDGREVESFSVDADHLALLEGGVLVAIDESGAMFRVSPQQPTLAPIGSIELAGETIQHVAATQAVPRLVIVTDETVRLFTADGERVAELSPPEPAPLHRPVDPSAQCVMVGDRTFTTFEVTTGTVVSELTGLAVHQLSDDGCAVLVAGPNGDSIVVDGVASTLADGESLLAASADARLGVLFGAGAARLADLTRLDEPGIALDLVDERVPRAVFFNG